MTDPSPVPGHTADDDRCERYVLGQLTDRERDDLEALAVADVEVAAAIDEAETTLADAFVSGSLEANRRAEFQTAMEERPRLRARVAAARTLAASAPSRRTRWWAAMAAAAILIVATAMWLSRPRPAGGDASPSQARSSETGPSSGSPAPSQPVVPAPSPAGPSSEPLPEATPPRAVPPRPVVYALTLPTGTLRAADVPVFRVPSEASVIRVTATVADGDDHPRFRLTLRPTSGAAAAVSVDGVIPESRRLTVDVERRRLPNGLYDVELYGLADSDTPAPLALLQIRLSPEP